MDWMNNTRKIDTKHFMYVTPYVVFGNHYSRKDRMRQCISSPSSSLPVYRLSLCSIVPCTVHRLKPCRSLVHSQKVPMKTSTVLSAVYPAFPKMQKRFSFRLFSFRFWPGVLPLSWQSRSLTRIKGLYQKKPGIAMRDILFHHHFSVNNHAFYPAWFAFFLKMSIIFGTGRRTVRSFPGW